MNTDNQLLLLVDNNDNFLGKYATRKECHEGKGLHHRAFVVLLQNSKKEVLLQKRKHKLWDNFWDTTAISHTIRLDDHNESYQEAANRALEEEMGIRNIKLKNIGGFNYFAKYKDNCENEYCSILTGEYNGKVAANNFAVYEYTWVLKEKFIRQCLENKQQYTPWAILTGKFLNENY